MISISDFQDFSLSTVDISEFEKTRICFLGGTGFIGTWLVSALNYLSIKQDVPVEMTVYTRDRQRAQQKFPRESFGKLKIIEFDFFNGSCDLGMHDFFVNGATPTSTKPDALSKEIFYYPTINAITSIIQAAKKYGNNPRVLNLSSGAVYGAQSMDMTLRPEGEAKKLEFSDDDYLAAKLVSEDMLKNPDVRQILKATSPRLFSFYGPGLPIDQHFAIGNFVRDGLMGIPIRINGNPETRRSYMFPTDLVVWLIKSILNPKDENLNVGSQDSISMFDLGMLISNLTHKRGVEVLNPKTPPNNYVPKTEIFRSIYDVKENVGIETGLNLWLSHLAHQKKS